MLANNFYILLGIVCCLQQLNVNAYPTINIRRLFDSAIEGRYKKSDLTLPLSDEDVLELEHLKHDEATKDSNESGDIHFEIPSAAHPAAAVPAPAVGMPMPVNPTDLSPDLEQQLEEVTTAKTGTISNAPGQREEETTGGAPHHRPPMLPQHDGGQVSNNQQQQQPSAGANDEDANVGSESNSGSPPMLTKPFYGAARLAFGQNPEVLPSTSTTTTTTVATTSIASPTNENIPESIITTSPSVQTVETSAALPPADADQDQINPPSSKNNEDNSNPPPPPQPSPSSSLSSSSPSTTTVNPNEKEQLGDSIVSQLETTKPGPERRSMPMMPPKTAENLLKHKDGQYSSFDMAQYVFWTGDEAGVARAVEEFIEQGLMSRENAIKFLRDIRLGIEYLQSSYANRVFPDQLRDNYIKKHSHNTHQMPTPAAVVTTTSKATTTSTTTRRPAASTTTARTRAAVAREYAAGQLALNQHLDKTLESVPSLLRLQDINNAHDRENTEYDEAAGRAKIAKFLYTEFSLEEVIYQLAKVMFSQSLAHGSDQAQQALQRLTDFLEVEGRHGMISPELQKKVLDVLLSALSDTLVEHPELLAAARANLGSSFEKIPINSLETIKN